VFREEDASETNQLSESGRVSLRIQLGGLDVVGLGAVLRGVGGSACIMISKGCNGLIVPHFYIEGFAFSSSPDLLF